MANTNDERLERAWCVQCASKHTVSQNDIVMIYNEVGESDTQCRYGQVVNVDERYVRIRYWERTSSNTRPGEVLLGQGTCVTMGPSSDGAKEQTFDVRVDEIACMIHHVHGEVLLGHHSLDIAHAVLLAVEACVYELMKHRSGHVRLYEDGCLRSLDSEPTNIGATGTDGGERSSEPGFGFVRATKIGVTATATGVSGTAATASGTGVTPTATVTGTCNHIPKSKILNRLQTPRQYHWRPGGASRNNGLLMVLLHISFVEALFSTKCIKFCSQRNELFAHRIRRSRRSNRIIRPRLRSSSSGVVR